MSTPSLPSPSSPAHVQSVLGMVAFMCAGACTRYAKDADKAPSMGPRVELLHMSAERVAAFDTVSELGRRAGADVSAGAERFIGSL
ncbi:MAG: tRNA 2-methylthio-N6-isopentenyl adenosine(37) hydroxylase MiaE-like protein, partial [Actinomyces sp.]